MRSRPGSTLLLLILARREDGNIWCVNCIFCSSRRLNSAPGYQIAQVRVVFMLPSHLVKQILPLHIQPLKYLVYVEWFSMFKPQPERHHLMYKVSHVIKNGDRLASIILVGNIRHSVYLLPKFGPVAPPEWKSHNVLDKCPVFFANPWMDCHMYATLY
jgi:hypothetical protein